ncbi:MAG: GNAT family N-acetyltransferase [Isosphaeraceae bacterium]|nr:GNAT family N-acetyltransferase [Isosphaeraceae bacterium]
MIISVRETTVADIPFGMRLKEQAGWNQVEADWKRLLDLEPQGCFVAEIQSVPVGTVTSCRFGDVAWIALMLVDPDHRRRGVGRTLMSRALEWLDFRRIRSVRLDATPLGRPLYESLGFQAEGTLVRYQGVLTAGAPATELGNVSAADVFDGVAELDRAVTGADRARFLRTLSREHPESFQVARERGRVIGFIMARPGAYARQIGPCIGDDEAGPRLLEDARRRYAGETVIVDIPQEHTRARRLVESWGLAPARELLRMGYGPRVQEDLDRLWASAGAEKG